MRSPQRRPRNVETYGDQKEAHLLGAIAGDVIGSVQEGSGRKTKDFPLLVPDSTFTDDTVLTVAIADSLLHGKDYTDALHEYFHAYPTAGFGGTFLRWAWHRLRKPYQSWGNGSAMRVSATAYTRDTLDEVLEEARRSAAVTRPRAGHPRRPGRRRGGLPRPHRLDQRADPPVHSGPVRLLSRRDAGRHPADVRVRCLVPGVGAAVDPRVPRIDGL